MLHLIVDCSPKPALRHKPRGGFGAYWETFLYICQKFIIPVALLQGFSQSVYFGRRDVTILEVIGVVTIPGLITGLNNI